MKATVVNKRYGWAVQCLVAIIYFLLAISALKYAALVDGETIIWPAAGFAIAALVRLGLRYGIGVLMGALAAGIYTGAPYQELIASTLSDTLVPILTVYLLQFLPFSANFYRLNDYLSLVFAGCIGVMVGTLLCTTVYIYAGLASFGEAYATIMNAWMSDVLGIVIVTPLLLLFTPDALFKVVTRQSIEALLLIAFTTVIALMVLMGWNFGFTMVFKSSYLLAIPLVWSILRFGQMMAALIVFEYTLIGIAGLQLNQGFFVDVNSQANLILFWLYFMVMGLISLTLSYIVNERNMLYQAINQSQAGNYIFNGRDLQFEFINNATLNALGVPFNEALKLGPVDLKPGYDQQQFRKILAPLLKKERTAVSFETMIKTAAGDALYPAEIHIQNIEDMNRDCYFASVIDISERLAKEQQLRLGNQVCELTPQAIMVTDKDNLIIRINKAFSDITGYQADEVLGRHPKILNSDRHKESFYEALWTRLHDDKLWKGEVFSRRKNGEVYLQSLTVKLLHDEQGNIEHYIAMFTDITQEREQALHFKQLAEFDNLTNLPNRIVLQQSFESTLALAKRHKRQLALLYVDLNDFKLINDTYGHAMGDRVLRESARRMKACIRDGDIVSRVGGDEFSVLLNEIEGLAICHRIVEKLKKVIAQPITQGEITVQITASIGVANYPQHGDTLEALLDGADRAMYTDKEKMKKG